MPLGPPTLRPTKQSLTKWWIDLYRHTTSCLGEVAVGERTSLNSLLC